MPLVALAILAALAAGCTDGGPPSGDDPLIIGAASDLMGVFTELGDAYESSTGDRVTFTFGSSGQLAQQLREGAPMDVYASADARFVDIVLDAGIGVDGSRTPLGRGRLVIWAPDGVDAWPDLRALADDPDVASIAIANPDHAPYGRAAREALRSAGVWDVVEDRLVFGENIADTQRLAASRNVDVALTALALVVAQAATDAAPAATDAAPAASDAASDAAPAARNADGQNIEAAASDAWVLIDADAHAPLAQEVLVVTEDDERAARARAFVAAVTGPQAEDTLRRYGLRGDVARLTDAGRAGED